MDITPRREFWRRSIDELVAAFDEGHGRRSFKLSSLATLPDELITSIVPVTLDVSRVEVEDGRFVLRRVGSTSVLFEIGSADEEVWSLMDGQRTIQQITDAMTRNRYDGGDVAFAHVRRVFLHLVRLRLCVPRDPLK